MVWFFAVLGPMSLGVLPRVCAFRVPGQIKTHGYSGFENDVEDLVSDLPATFDANDVPAAFCAPEVSVDAAMIASDCWVSMLAAALSALEDAAMLCFMESMWNDESGASHLMKNAGFGWRSTALMVKWTGTQLRVLILLACACGSLFPGFRWWFVSSLCEPEGSCLRILFDGSNEKGRCCSFLVSSGMDVCSTCSSYSAPLLLQPGDRACSSCV